MGEQLGNTGEPDHTRLARRAVFGEEGLLIMDANGEMFDRLERPKSLGERVVASEAVPPPTGATISGIRLNPAA